ncbi:eukaryotic translation initiation factor 3, gamma subunit [Aspergillus ambiguus]|uniref:tRNA 1-methyladenosine methyltransferase subunit GCD10 n=1 Tax=Aspergillus ambiguus TaxID=176160 RepID=UPI003CCE53E9
MHSYVRPDQFVLLRLPNELTRIQKVTPNTMIYLGKFGSFPANQIIGRPFYLTFDILETSTEKDGSCLRVVPAAELHAESLIAEGEADGDEPDYNPDGTPLRTNREIVDDASTQKLTWEEIEALKKEAGGSGREIIAKILDSHSAIDQKTAFSLAKYTLRKRRKYMKRFTILPLDVSLLTNYMMQDNKDAVKIMEMRDECIGLVGCWANVHHSGATSMEQMLASKPNGRYLVVDDTGGLMVAAMAERMGILYPHDGENYEEDETAPAEQSETTTANEAENTAVQRPSRPSQMSATENTITLIHPHKQPNLSLLKFFGYEQHDPYETHPLFTNLKTISWLQLLEPNSDLLYAEEPESLSEQELSTMKTSRRSQYFRKRTRWARVKQAVDETRAGGFDGLVVATLMDPETVLKHTVPLLAGSAPVVVYSPTVEPLTNLMDLYSTARKTAYINRKQELKQQEQLSNNSGGGNDFPELEEEFGLNPTLLLASALETSRVRHWQVLPGRTHPLMSGRGGAEGYIFHATRVLPTEREIQAAGNPSRKRRKVTTTTSTPTPTADSASGVDVEMKA